jgi:hypothetical protein
MGNFRLVNFAHFWKKTYKYKGLDPDLGQQKAWI